MSTLVKMPHCWKSHVAAQIMIAATLHPGDNESKQSDFTLPQLYYQWLVHNPHPYANTKNGLDQLMDIRPFLVWNAFKSYALAICV